MAVTAMDSELKRLMEQLRLQQENQKFQANQNIFNQKPNKQDQEEMQRLALIEKFLSERQKSSGWTTEMGQVQQTQPKREPTLQEIIDAEVRNLKR